MEYEIRRKVDRSACIKLDERGVAVMDDFRQLRFSRRAPVLGPLQGAQWHRVSLATVHLAENHGLVTRKPHMSDPHFIRFHVLASTLRSPRWPALCGARAPSSTHRPPD